MFEIAETKSQESPPKLLCDEVQTADQIARFVIELLLKLPSESHFPVQPISTLSLSQMVHTHYLESFAICDSLLESQKGRTSFFSNLWCVLWLALELFNDSCDFLGKVGQARYHWLTTRATSRINLANSRLNLANSRLKLASAPMLVSCSRLRGWTPKTFRVPTGHSGQNTGDPARELVF